MEAIALKEPAGRFALRSALPTVSEDSERTWIHVAVEGSWKGHPSGDFTLDRGVFGEVIRNFEARSHPIPLTYGHPRGTEGEVDGAAGWIHERELRDDGLWAFTEFTDRAAAQIKAGEHRFCSVVLGFDSVDRKTGERIGAELHEVGLVLSAFLDELNEIRLSAREVRAEEPSMAEEETSAAPMGKADAAVMRIVEEVSAMGHDADATAIVAFMETGARAIAQLFASETEGGEDAEEMATLSRKAADAIKLSHQLDGRVRDLELSHRLRDIVVALRLGHARETERTRLERWARENPQELELALKEGRENPAVPCGSVYAPRVKLKRTLGGHGAETTAEREAEEVRELSAREETFYNQFRRTMSLSHADALKRAREKA